MNQCRAIVLALVLVAPGAYAKKKKKRKKKGAEEPPPVGEVVLNGWTCYGSPDFGGGPGILAADGSRF